MDQTNPEPKQCCGKDPLITYEQDFLSDEELWAVRCSACGNGCSGYETRKEAIENWNLLEFQP